MLNMTSRPENYCLRLFLAAVLGAGLLVFGPAFAHAQVDDVTRQAEREGCVRNLKLIYDAIQASQMDHHDVPNWLSDLVPQYLTDANVLICPVCKRTGQ